MNRVVRTQFLLEQLAGISTHHVLQEVASVDDALYVVEVSVEHGDSAVSSRHHLLGQLVDWRAQLCRHHVHAGDHNLPCHGLVLLDHRVDHPDLSLVQGLSGGLGWKLNLGGNQLGGSVQRVIDPSAPG